MSPAVPEDLHPFTRWLSDRKLICDWAVCAFGKHEPSCLEYAARMGGKCRVGFENSFYLSTGDIAESNIQKVVDLRENLGMRQGEPIVTHGKEATN